MTVSAHRWDTASGLTTIDLNFDYIEQIEEKPLPVALTDVEKQAETLASFPLTKIATTYVEDNAEAKRDTGKDPIKVVFLLDFHKYLDENAQNNTELWRLMQNNYATMEGNGIVAVIISPTIRIPDEIQDYVVALDYAYPDAEYIRNAITIYIPILYIRIRSR